jgi:hypothetical protein
MDRHYNWQPSERTDSQIISPETDGKLRIRPSDHLFCIQSYEKDYEMNNGSLKFAKNKKRRNDKTHRTNHQQHPGNL